MSTFNTSLSYHNSSSYPSDTGGNEGGLNTDTGGLHSRAREKYPNLLRGSGVAAEASPTGEFVEGVERIAYRATSNYFARVLNLPQDSDGRLRVDKENVFRHFDWKNERVADMTVDSIFDDVISQVAAERSRRGQGSRSNVKVHPDLTASKFTADKGDYASRLDQMIQSIGGPELLEALRKASELITSQMDEDEEDSDSDISSPNMRAPDMPPAPSVPTSARPVIGSAKAAGASQGSSKAGASSGASSASSAEAQAAQEKIAKALESGGDDLVSLSENDELMKHASEEQKSEMIAKLQEHSDKKGKCDSRPEGNKADRAIANVMQSANDKSEFDNLMKAHGGQELLHSVEYGEAKQSLVQAAAAWGSNEFIDEKHQEKYSKEIAASQDLFLNPPDKSSKIQPPAVGSYGSDPTATGLERVESETNAYIADQAYTNLSPRAQREMLLMNAQRASEGKEAVDNTEVISEVERLRSRTLAQIEAGDEDSYKEQWEAWKQGLERIRKEHDMSEDAFRHTVTSRYENFYLGTNVSFGEPDSGEKDERSNEEKYHSYTRDEADLEQLREKYGQAPASAINGLDASSSLGATGVAGQAAQEELHKLLQEYEQAVAEEGFESRRAETLRQEIADLEESSSEYTADLNKIGVELDTLYQPPPADTFWLKFTEVFLAVAELAMTLAAAAFLGPAGVALVSAGWAIYHATQKDWMAMAGSLAGGAVGGMGAASGAIAKSAAKGSQTGATLARGIGSKAATSTTKAAATTGAKSASSFSQNVSNLVAKTGKAGQFMGLNPSDDVLITTGKLTNMSQTTFETSYAASQGDALGAASSSLGLSQEGMNARRLTRLTQNSATAAVTTTYTVQAGQKFADGNYQGAFDLIGGVSNVGNLSGSNEHFKAGIGGVNEGLPTIDYSRSENLDTATADAPDKESSLSGSEEADAVESAEETKRTEAEEAERVRVAEELEQKRLTGRSSQVKVEQMFEDILGADVAKNIDAYYDPTMPEGQVRYTPDPDEQGKLQLSYGPKSNEQNIQWHVEHLDALLDYQGKNVDRGDYIPELSTPEAITQLEFDKHEVLMNKAQAVLDDDTGKYTAADKAMAKENLAIYEQEQIEIMQRISSEEHSHQLDTEGRRQVAAGGEEAGPSTSRPAKRRRFDAAEPAESIRDPESIKKQKELAVSKAMNFDPTGEKIYTRIINEESNIKFFAVPPDSSSKEKFLALLNEFSKNPEGKKLLYELDFYQDKHELQIMLFAGNNLADVQILGQAGPLVRTYQKPFEDIPIAVRKEIWNTPEDAALLPAALTPGVGTSALMQFDPEGSSVNRTDGYLPTDVVFYHELVHALDLFKGTGYGDEKHQGIHTNEYNTVGMGPYLEGKSENLYRESKGLPLRERYSHYFFNSKESEAIVREKIKEIGNKDGESPIDPSVLDRLEVKYDPEMPVNGVEYSFPARDSDKITFAYGPSSNWMNIEFHARHLDVLAHYNNQESAAVQRNIPNIDDDYRAHFQLEHDLYSKLVEYADQVIQNSETNDLEKYVAEKNKSMYQARLMKLESMISEDGKFEFPSERVIGRPIDDIDQDLIDQEIRLDFSYLMKEPTSLREEPLSYEGMEQRYKDKGQPSLSNPSQIGKTTSDIQNLSQEELLGLYGKTQTNEHRAILIRNLSAEQVKQLFEPGVLNSDDKQFITQSLTPEQIFEAYPSREALQNASIQNFLRPGQLSDVGMLYNMDYEIGFDQYILSYLLSDSVDKGHQRSIMENLTPEQMTDLYILAETDEQKEFIIKNSNPRQLLKMLERGEAELNDGNAESGDFLREAKESIIQHSSDQQKMGLIQYYKENPEVVRSVIQGLGLVDVMRLIEMNKDPRFQNDVITNLSGEQVADLMSEKEGNLDYQKFLRRNLTTEQLYEFLKEDNPTQLSQLNAYQAAEMYQKAQADNEPGVIGKLEPYFTENQLIEFIQNYDMQRKLRPIFIGGFSTDHIVKIMKDKRLNSGNILFLIKSLNTDHLSRFLSCENQSKPFKDKMVANLELHQLIDLHESNALKNAILNQLSDASGNVDPLIKLNDIFYHQITLEQIEKILTSESISTPTKTDFTSHFKNDPIISLFRKNFNKEEKLENVTSEENLEFYKNIAANAFTEKELLAVISDDSVLHTDQKNILGRLTPDSIIRVINHRDTTHAQKNQILGLLFELQRIIPELHLPEGQVRYSPDLSLDSWESKVLLSYGPSPNRQNILWHLEHLGALVEYDENPAVGRLIPEKSDPAAITQLEFDKHEKLIAKAQAVIDDETSLPDDRIMAKLNQAIYENELEAVLEYIERDEDIEQVGPGGERYVAAGGSGASTSHAAQRRQVEPPEARFSELTKLREGELKKTDLDKQTPEWFERLNKDEINYLLAVSASGVRTGALKQKDILLGKLSPQQIHEISPEAIKSIAAPASLKGKDKQALLFAKLSSQQIVDTFKLYEINVKGSNSIKVFRGLLTPEQLELASVFASNEAGGTENSTLRGLAYARELNLAEQTPEWFGRLTKNEINDLLVTSTRRVSTGVLKQKDILLRELSQEQIHEISPEAIKLIVNPNVLEGADKQALLFEKLSLKQIASTFQLYDPNLRRGGATLTSFLKLLSPVQIENIRGADDGDIDVATRNEILRLKEDIQNSAGGSLSADRKKELLKIDFSQEGANVAGLSKAEIEFILIRKDKGNKSEKALKSKSDLIKKLSEDQVDALSIESIKVVLSLGDRNLSGKGKMNFVDKLSLSKIKEVFNDLPEVGNPRQFYQQKFVKYLSPAQTENIRGAGDGDIDAATRNNILRLKGRVVVRQRPQQVPEASAPQRPASQQSLEEQQSAYARAQRGGSYVGEAGIGDVPPAKRQRLQEEADEGIPGGEFDELPALGLTGDNALAVEDISDFQLGDLIDFLSNSENSAEAIKKRVQSLSVMELHGILMVTESNEAGSSSVAAKSSTARNKLLDNLSGSQLKVILLNSSVSDVSRKELMLRADEQLTEQLEEVAAMPGDEAITAPVLRADGEAGTSHVTEGGWQMPELSGVLPQNEHGLPDEAFLPRPQKLESQGAADLVAEHNAGIDDIVPTNFLFPESFQGAGAAQDFSNDQAEDPLLIPGLDDTTDEPLANDPLNAFLQMLNDDNYSSVFPEQSVVAEDAQDVVDSEADAQEVTAASQPEQAPSTIRGGGATLDVFLNNVDAYFDEYTE